MKLKRGRPRKIVLSQDDRIEDLLEKMFTFSLSDDGKVMLTRNESFRLTYDDAAFMLWNYDGRKTPKPLSKVGMMKTEQRICSKMKSDVVKHCGIKSMDDVIDPKYRCAASKYGCTEDPE